MSEKKDGKGIIEIRFYNFGTIAYFFEFSKDRNLWFYPLLKMLFANNFYQHIFYLVDRYSELN